MSSAPNDRLARLMEEAGFDSHKAFARAVFEESRRVGEPLRRCDHTYVLRWLQGMVPRGKTPVFIASALSRALRRPVTMADLGMPLAGHLPALDVGMAYPDSPTAAIDNLSLLWQADLSELTALQRSRVDPGAWNDASLRWLLDPGYHWTEQKIRVHVFYCVLALATAHLMRRQAAQAGLDLSVRELLRTLAGIGETVLLYPCAGGRPRARRMLTDRDHTQQHLFDLFGLAAYAPRA